MGEGPLGEIDAGRVGERIAAAARGARLTALLAGIVVVVLVGLLALNDARLAADGRRAARLGEAASRTGARLLGLADDADALVRERGVRVATGWDDEAGRRYAALIERMETTFEEAPDLSGEARLRLRELESELDEFLSHTQEALVLAALNHPAAALEWINSPTHRAHRVRIGGRARVVAHAARALGERRVETIAASRMRVALGGAAGGLALLVFGVGLSLRRSEKAVRAAGEELARRAEFCPLTGLPNRAGFDALLARRVEAGHPFALVVTDLDGFKSINDVYGQAAGDRVLRQVARRLSRFLGSTDGDGAPCAARLGGDEFAAFVPLRGGSAGTAARERRALASAEDLRTAVAGDVALGEGAASFGASLGVACFPEHASDAGALHAAADLALHRAKEAEGGVRLYDRAFDEERRAFNAQKREVARALAADEIEPFLQPVVALEDGRVVSFEMLARWRRGDCVVGPGLFLPAIEKAGLLDAMTLALLGKVLDTAEGWTQPVPVSVNMAASQLRSRGFIERLGPLLDRADALGLAIEVELLEESVFSDAAATRLGLDALRARGVRLALDDFGVGYSNFAQLGRVRIDKIKIDRSFVMGIDGAAAAAVVRAALDISSAIGVRTVAEGIEDGATAERLRAMGCPLGQGYHFARPAPLAEATRMLEASADDASGAMSA